MAVRKTGATPAARPARSASWTAKQWGIFLETLAATSNVAASERKANMPAGSAYYERRKTPAFADAWADALADGYSRLELALLERALMVEGPSGLLAIAPPGKRPDWQPSLRRLRWPNGAEATLYGASEPEALRGAQHSHRARPGTEGDGP